MDKIETFLQVTGLMEDLDAISNQLKALEEESDELDKAISEDDKIEVLDAIGDTGFIIHTLLILDPDNSTYTEYLDNLYMKFSPAIVDEVIDRVAESNLSKFDDTAEDAADTREHYLKLSVPTKTECIEGIYVTRCSEDTYDLNGKYIFQGKILKSVNNFKDVELEDLLESI